jgi:predicted NAD/FAD-binding protein
MFPLFSLCDVIMFKGLAAPCTTKTSIPVERVERQADGTVLVTDAAGGSSVFDHVIYACNARSAEETLQGKTLLEQVLLGSVMYTDDNDVSMIEGVIHHDASIIPEAHREEVRRRGARRGSAERGSAK